MNFYAYDDHTKENILLSCRSGKPGGMKIPERRLPLLGGHSVCCGSAAVFLDVKPCVREGNLTESRHAPVHDVLCDAFARRMRYAHKRGTGAGGRGAHRGQ